MSDNKKVATPLLVEEKLLSALRESVIPLITEKSVREYISLLESKSKLLVEEKEKELSILSEQLETQNVELKLVSEQLEKLSEEYENKVNLISEQKQIVESRLIESDAKVYAHNLMVKNLKLRPFFTQLLECKNKLEVDKIVTVLEKVEPISRTTQKGIIPEVFKMAEKYGDRNPEILEQLMQYEVEGSESLDEDEEDTLRLSGIKNHPAIEKGGR